MNTKKTSHNLSPFVPHTPGIEKEMLDEMSVDSFEDLISDIPDELRINSHLTLDSAKSEFEVTTELQNLSRCNKAGDELVCFLGGGAYDHFIPTAVGAITSRSEFATSYTPYQAEVSQGTLQSIYEFQTMICEITGMEAANASLYDGASAVAEACLTATRVNNKSTVLLSEGLYHHYVDVVKTYLKHSHLNIEMIPSTNGLTDLDWLNNRIDENVSSVVVQSPNRVGLMENWKEMGELCGKHPALFVAVGDPTAYGLFASPGECGADIYAGEGQPLGIPLSFGGPYLGLFATKMDYIRKVPGRLVGATKDLDGKPGFVLTFQTREQHIRRERATSNICTNQGLMALTACVFMSLMGKEGMKRVAELCFQKAYYAAKEIEKLNCYSLPFGNQFFKEFVVECPNPAKEIIEKGVEEGLMVGTTLSDHPNYLRVAVTEKRTKGEIDGFVLFLKNIGYS